MVLIAWGSRGGSGVAPRPPCGVGMNVRQLLGGRFTCCASPLSVEKACDAADLALLGCRSENFRCEAARGLPVALLEDGLESVWLGFCSLDF